MRLSPAASKPVARLIALVAALTFLSFGIGLNGASAGQGTARAPVSLAPPQLPPVSLASGSFMLWVSVADLNHHGRIGYDTDRDTVPDTFVDSEGFGSFEFTIDYDPAYLQVKEARQGSLSGATNRHFQCISREDEPGSFSFGCISSGGGAGRQGSFTLAEVGFEPVRAGTSVVEMHDVQLSGPYSDDIATQVANSSSLIEVGGGSNPPGNTTNNPPGGNNDPGSNPSNQPGESGGPGTTGNSGGPGSNDPNDPSNATSNGPGSVTIADPADDVAGGPEGEGDPADGGNGGSLNNPDGDNDQGSAQADVAGSSGRDGLSVGLWSAVIAGGAVAAAGVGMAAFRWRRMRVGTGSEGGRM